MPANSTEQLRQALNNANVRAFLDMLSAAEHTEEHGYATAFGGALLPSLKDHPRVRAGFTQTDGRRNETTAAGRYQFLERTWDDVAKKLGLSDFGPESQDLAAVELLRRANALDPILNGDFTTAIERSGKTWASLPSSPYAQPKRSAEFIASRLPQMPDLTPPSWAKMIPSGPPSVTPPLAPTAAPAAAVAAPVAAPIVPPLAPGESAPSQALVPATAPNAVRQLLALMAPQPTSATETRDPEFDDLDDDMLAAGLDADVSEFRNKAQAQFFGEPYVPEVPLPPALDSAIERYLAML